MNRSDKKSDISNFLPYGREQINYLVNCSSKYKFVYVETPKVACSTIKRVLQLIDVEGNVEKLPNHVHDRAKSPLKSPFTIGVSPVALFDGDEYFRFSFVRNPYSRILSAYLDKIVMNQWERERLLPTLGFKKDAQISLLQFLEAIRDIPHIKKDIHWKPQSHILQPHRIKYHFVGRFENFSSGFERVIKKIKPDADDSLFATRADNHKTGASEKILEYIGPKEQKLILEIYENDFEAFRYSEDPHFGAV